MSHKVRFRCPGCGSELETPEGTVSNLCKYCGLVSLLGRPGRIVKRYYLPSYDVHEARVIIDRQMKKEGWPQFPPATVASLHYLPFYRFRGLSLTCVSKRRVPSELLPEPTGELKTYELRARHLDVTIPGCATHPFGLSSLGVRPQAIPTWAWRDQEVPAAARVWPVDREARESEEAAMRMNDANLVMTHGEKADEFAEVVGEHQSLIYFPVYVATGPAGAAGAEATIVLDGLSKRIIKATLGRWQPPFAGASSNSVCELVPEPHRCPNCGADLPASERSIVYACTNCQRIWQLERSGFAPLATPLVGEGTGDLYPFWRIPISFARHPGFETVGAFSRLLTADIPLLDKRKRELPFFVYVPAFAGADADWHVLTAVRMTRIQPFMEMARKMPLEAVAVSLLESEGREFARFAWDWLRMGYLNLRSDAFAWKAAVTGHTKLAWLPITCDRLSRSVQRAGQEVTAMV